MKVSEIFRSIQGEGYWSGRSAVFVRFSGCNLECPWCDTDHSDGLEMDMDEIAELARHRAHHHDNMVVLTGGEPTLQAHSDLLSRLFRRFRLICLETNGTNVPPMFYDAKHDTDYQMGQLWVTVSPKSPTTWRELPGLGYADEIKVVVPGGGWSRAQLAELADVFKEPPTRHLYLQPEDGLEREDAKRWAIGAVMNDPRWRISLQIHKLLGLS